MMQSRVSLAEGAALQGLLEDATSDIVVRIDAQGFIETASANLIQIGYDLSQLLLKPHLAELAESAHTPALKGRIDQVLSSKMCENGSADWLEFPIGVPNSEAGETRSPPTWYALSLRALAGADGVVTGAMGLLRSIERNRALEGEIHSRALVDPLTGLANRHAFCAALKQQLAGAEDAVIAMFEIDRMRAVVLQYGQRTADEIIWGFARFLEAMVGEDFKLAQFDGERFCVMLSGLSLEASRNWAKEVLTTFGSLALTPSSRRPHLSASAGLASVEGNVDQTLRQAELALVMARARGGMRVEQGTPPIPFTQAGASAAL
ncbi:MAG: GGDEF domain-containing protein [Pseudomonadota bacterium]